MAGFAEYAHSAERGEGNKALGNICFFELCFIMTMNARTYPHQSQSNEGHQFERRSAILKEPIRAKR